MNNQNDQTLHRILNEWHHWPEPYNNKPTVVKNLSNGRTNTSYLIEICDQMIVLRLEACNSHALGINRDLEKKVLHALSSKPYCPRFIYSNSQKSYALIDYIEGRNWTVNDIHNKQQRNELNYVINDIQTLQLNEPNFNYIAHLKHYQTELSKRNLSNNIMRLDEFNVFLSQFTQQEWCPTLCHHDLVPENIIETKNGLVIIDWEYAGMGHPEFDQRYLGSQLLIHPEQLMQGDCIDQLIYWLNYYWRLIQTPHKTR